MDTILQEKAGTTIQSFMDLHAWQEAHAFVLMIYRATKTFPKEELYGLVSQLRRAAVSVSSNIAEGFRRKSATEKVHFYTMALSSLTECQNQLIVSRDIPYLAMGLFQELTTQANRVGRLINGLMKHAPDRPY